MKTSNKISIIRIFLTFIIILSCTFPFYVFGINAPKLNIGGLVVESLYLASGALFILTIILDIWGSSTRTNSENEKNLDMLADKFLINSVLIIFAVRGFIPVLVPIIYIIRDEVVYVLKIDAARCGKILEKTTASRVKTFAMLFGLCLMFFYNLPFELINIKVADFLIYFGMIMALVSGIEYLNSWKKIK